MSKTQAAKIHRAQRMLCKAYAAHLMRRIRDARRAGK